MGRASAPRPSPASARMKGVADVPARPSAHARPPGAVAGAAALPRRPAHLLRAARNVPPLPDRPGLPAPGAAAARAAARVAGPAAVPAAGQLAHGHVLLPRMAAAARADAG